MPAPKKYTQFIFDHIQNPTNKPESYGYLGLAFEVCANLSEIRNIKMKITQKELAEKAGVSQSAIAVIESGRGNPTLSQLVKITHALGHKIKFEPAQFPPGDYEGYLE